MYGRTMLLLNPRALVKPFALKREVGSSNVRRFPTRGHSDYVRGQADYLHRVICPDYQGPCRQLVKCSSNALRIRRGHAANGGGLMHYTQGSRHRLRMCVKVSGGGHPHTRKGARPGWNTVDTREEDCQHRLRHLLCTTPGKQNLLPRSGKNLCQVPAHIVPFRMLGALSEAPGHSLTVYVDMYVYTKHITRGIKIGNDDQSYVKDPCCKTSQMSAHLEALVPTNFGQSSLTACMVHSMLTHVRTCNGWVPRPTLHGRTQRNDGRSGNSLSGT